MASHTCTLVEVLSEIEDPRRQNRNTKHPLADILGLSLCAVLAGADDFVEIYLWAKAHEDFLRTFLDLPNGIPSHDTINRVFALIDPMDFQQALLDWIAKERGTPTEAIHIDGKAMRRTRSKARGIKALHLVSAWASEQGLTLGQVAVDDKSNEITAIPHLLDLLDLREKVVTIDAAGCQTDIARQIVEKGGDYVLALKGNQETLHEAVAEAFLEADANADPALKQEVFAEKPAHGRTERRHVAVLPATKVKCNTAAWLGLVTVIMVIRVLTCPVTGQETAEVRYFISSLKGNPRRFGKLVRSHWSIENGLHWVLDVVFREDARGVYDHTAAQNIGFLNRLAVSLLRGIPGKESLKNRRKRAGWCQTFLGKILGFHPISSA